MTSQSWAWHATRTRIRRSDNRSKLGAGTVRIIVACSELAHLEVGCQTLGHPIYAWVHSRLMACQKQCSGVSRALHTPAGATGHGHPSLTSEHSVNG